LPYWLWVETRWHLYDQDYAPNALERGAVAEYLSTRGVFPSRNTINQWLGVASRDTSFLLKKPKRPRWNQSMMSGSRIGATVQFAGSRYVATSITVLAN
jgi:hypothetical protein